MHVDLDCWPTNVVPVVGCQAGSRTGPGRADTMCLLPDFRHLPVSLNRFYLFSRDERPRGSGHTFVSGIRPYPPHYRVAFASSAIPYPLSHRFTLRLTVPCGRATGLPRSTHVPTDGLGPASSPVAMLSAEGHELIPSPCHVPFWFAPSALRHSTFGALELHDVYSGSHLLTMPSNPASDHLGASSHRLSSRRGGHPVG